MTFRIDAKWRTSQAQKFLAFLSHWQQPTRTASHSVYFLIISILSHTAGDDDTLNWRCRDTCYNKYPWLKSIHWLQGLKVNIPKDLCLSFPKNLEIGSIDLLFKVLASLLEENCHDRQFPLEFYPLLHLYTWTTLSFFIGAFSGTETELGARIWIWCPLLKTKNV